LITHGPASGPSDAHPRILGAVRALREAGIASAVTMTGLASATSEHGALEVVDDERSISAVLAPLGFGEVAPGRGPERLFVAYDAADDRWLRLRLLMGHRPTRRSTIGATGLRSARRGMRAIRGNASLWVALLGPDGTGKSSLAAGLARSLAVPVSRFYGGLYPAGRRRYRLPGVGTAATLIRLWRTTALATFASRRGRVVIFDRHPLDAALPIQGAGRLHRWRSAILARACPRPDLLVVLDAPVDVLHGRRREQPAEVLEVQRRSYAALARTIPASIVVDATNELDDVRRHLTDVIWRAYAERRARES
jgi:thymidylate kinase